MDEQRLAIRDAYDEIAPAYDAERRSVAAPLQSMVADLGAGLPDGAHVLDAGCGAGVPITTTLLEHVDVTGVDFSGEQLRMATDRAPAAGFVRGDVTALPFDEDAFDALVCLFTIIHVPWAEQLACAREFHRVCRTDAPILLTVGTDDWEGTNENWIDAGAEMQWTIPGPERAVGILGEAGFSVQGRARYVDPVGDEEGEMVVVQALA